MKRILGILLALSLALALTGCAPAAPAPTPTAQSSGEEHVICAFDDSGVQFTIEVPETWNKTELLGNSGSENQEASPSVGLQFPFDEEGKQLFAIMASLNVPFEVDESLFQAEPYQTDSGLAGVRYTREENGERMEYIRFGEADVLPQLVAVIVMSSEQYAVHQAEIEAAVKSLTIG